MVLLFNNRIKIYILSIILIIILFLMILISIFCKFKFYSSYSGIVKSEGGKFYVSCLFDNNEYLKIKESFLVYDKKQIDYEIRSIDEDYVLTDNGPKKLVHISIDLDERDKINNNVIQLKFGEEKTLFQKFKEMFI